MPASSKDQNKKKAVEKKKTTGGKKKPAANSQTTNRKTNQNNAREVDRVPRGGGGGQTYEPPSRLIVIVWLLVGAELALDLVTTVISFIAFTRESYCCEEQIELGALPLGITIPFFLLIVFELCMLILEIKNNICTSRAQMAREAAASAEEDNISLTRFLGKTFHQKLINGMLLLNPFFGFMVAWMLLYQSNKNESFIVLGLEAGSLVLHWLSVYLEGNKQSWCSLAIHSIPIIPFLTTIIVTLVYLEVGGVCYLVEDTLFWYKGCTICEDGTLPQSGLCPDGTEGTVDDYCSKDVNFCWFPYND